MQPRFNFVDLVQNFHRMDADLLASFIERHDSGVHLLSAPYHPEKAEMVTGDQIRRILLFLRQHYDYVVVDTSKSFSPATLATFEQADQVFLVTTADLPSLRNIQRGLPMMRRVLVRGEDQLRLVINRFDPKDQISVKDIERSLGLKVFWKLSNDYEAVLGSLNTGKPIVLNGTSSYSKDLKSLGVTAGRAPRDETERRGRILGRLEPVHRRQEEGRKEPWLSPSDPHPSRRSGGNGRLSLPWEAPEPRPQPAAATPAAPAAAAPTSAKAITACRR